MGNANPTIEASLETVCDSVSWQTGRKLAYGLVKNTLYFCTGSRGSTTRLFFSFLKCRLDTYSDRPGLTRIANTLSLYFIKIRIKK